MSLFDIFKKKGKEPDKKQQIAETVTDNQNSDKSIASGKEIIAAIDALLFSMRSAKKYPLLTEENIADLTKRFNNISHVLGSVHSDFDVSQLDLHILALVKSLENQIADEPMEEWNNTLKRLNDAVRARLDSEFEIHMAALDMVELYLLHTNIVFAKQIKDLEAIQGMTSKASDKEDSQEMIDTIKANIKANQKHLTQIKTDRAMLKSNTQTPSKQDYENINALLKDIGKEVPRAEEISVKNVEMIRERVIENETRRKRLREARERLEDVLNAVDMPVMEKEQKIEEASQTVVESMREAEQHREAEAVAE